MDSAVRRLCSCVSSKSTRASNLQRLLVTPELTKKPRERRPERRNDTKVCQSVSGIHRQLKQYSQFVGVPTWNTLASLFYELDVDGLATRHCLNRAVEGCEYLAESRLLEACQWLVAAGFPQYVQMLIEHQLTDSCISNLRSEHACLSTDWLQAVIRRAYVLLRYSNSKMNLSEDFLRSMDAFVIDEINRRALSYRWQYDHGCCRWQKTTSSSGVTSSPIGLYRSLSAVSAAANGELGSLSPSLADIDTGNHVTSGYESETTSPTNDRMMTSSSDVSPITSLSSTRSSGRSIPDSSLPSIMPCSSTPVAADTGGLVILRPRRSAVETMLPRTVSYYDNLIQSETVLADPQTELETILDDLRRNISALDAALAASSSTTTTPSSPGCLSPSEVTNSVCKLGSTDTHQLDWVNVSKSENGDSLDFGEHHPQPSNGSEWLLTSQWVDVRDRSLVSESSSAELAIARQLSVIHLTSLFDEHCKQTGSSVVDNLVRCVCSTLTTVTPGGHSYDISTRVFGVSLENQLRATGRVIPKCIDDAMNDVVTLADESEGIFRKPGILSRVQKLQDAMDTQPDVAVHCEVNGDVYNLADVIKRYYRDLPESLLTDRLSRILVAIFDYIPEKLRLEALQAAILLLPDVNRLAMYKLLSFLHEVASHSQQNQVSQLTQYLMTAANLAVCFLPSLFRLADYAQQAVQEIGQINEVYQPSYKSALSCLTSLIENSESLRQMGDETVSCIQLLTGRARSCLQLVPCTNSSAMMCGVDTVSIAVYVHSLMDKLNVLLQSETICWFPDRLNTSEDVAIVRQMSLSSGLFTFRATVDIEAPPGEVLSRLVAVQGRSDWDTDVTQWKITTRLDDCTDVSEYTFSIGELNESRRVNLLRSWQSHPSTGRCLLVSASVASQSQDESLLQQQATVLLSHYVIEPCGTGMSRLIHFSSIDLGGLTTDWYRTVYGRLCFRHVTSVRDSFLHDSWSQGPETKV